MINKIVFLFVFTMMLAGCESRRTVVSLTSPDMCLSDATLQIGQQTFNASVDTANLISFTLENVPSGFAILQFGNTRKMIFVEKGKDLTVQYKRVPVPGSSRYAFEGEGAPENIYLENDAPRVMMFACKPGEKVDVVRLFNDSVQQRQAVLAALKLSPDFKRLEGERQRYNVLRCFSRYKDWGEELYPYLKEQLKECPELLLTEDYQAFLLDALYAIGGERTDHTPHGYARGQLEYIRQCMQDTSVVDFALNSVMSRYMERRGAEAIDGFMEIFREKVHSPRIRQAIEELCSRWARVNKGQAIPDFTFLDVNDKEVALSAFKGKYVYIDCWATWCGPCKQQLPFLQKLERKYEGKEIVFVSISSDSNRDKWKKMVKEQKLGGVQLSEKLPTHSELSSYFMINAIPRFIILDKEGKVFDPNTTRPSDPATAELLDSLLAAGNSGE